MHEGNIKLHRPIKRYLTYSNTRSCSFQELCKLLQGLQRLETYHHLYPLPTGTYTWWAGNVTTLEKAQGQWFESDVLSLTLILDINKKKYFVMSPRIEPPILRILV